MLIVYSKLKSASIRTGYLKRKANKIKQIENNIGGIVSIRENVAYRSSLLALSEYNLLDILHPNKPDL